VLAIPEEFLGQFGKCKNCGEGFTVPSVFKLPTTSPDLSAESIKEEASPNQFLKKRKANRFVFVSLVLFAVLPYAIYLTINYTSTSNELEKLQITKKEVTENLQSEINNLRNLAEQHKNAANQNSKEAQAEAAIRKELELKIIADRQAQAEQEEYDNYWAAVAQQQEQALAEEQYRQDYMAQRRAENLEQERLQESLNEQQQIEYEKQQAELAQLEQEQQRQLALQEQEAVRQELLQQQAELEAQAFQEQLLAEQQAREAAIVQDLRRVSRDWVLDRVSNPAALQVKSFRFKPIPINGHFVVQLEVRESPTSELEYYQIEASLEGDYWRPIYINNYNTLSSLPVF
jgi:chemotaxis protein histidine kinase CheA